MKRTIQLVTALLSLALAPSLMYAQSGANPFGATPKFLQFGRDASFTKAHAHQAMGNHHRAKADADHLNKALDDDEGDFIVEYASSAVDENAQPHGDFHRGLAARKQEHRAVKQRVHGNFNSSEFRQVRDFDALPMAHVKLTGRRAMVKLLADPDVVAVYENTAGQRAMTESLPLIGQPAAAASGYTGAGTTVVVLDSGVDYTRAAFGSCTAPGLPADTCRVSVAFDVAPDDSSLDDSGHGTNVSGIVAGVAPDTKLAVLDVFTAGQGAYSSDVIAGINWAITNKATYNIQSINISIGWSTKYTSTCTSSWATAPFANARAAGILPVVAAANQGWTNGMPMPACASGAVRVGAVYDSNIGSRTWSSPLAACTDSATAADKVTCFSNSSSLLTLWAPGAVISAAGLNYSGTSQAAPHVAAAIAVLRAANAAPNDTVSQTVSRLTSTGISVKDTRNNVTKPRLNLDAATASIAVPSSATARALKAAR
jgi:subtilisin family serine protease